MKGLEPGSRSITPNNKLYPSFLTPLHHLAHLHYHLHLIRVIFFYQSQTNVTIRLFKYFIVNFLVFTFNTVLTEIHLLGFIINYEIILIIVPVFWHVFWNFIDCHSGFNLRSMHFCGFYINFISFKLFYWRMRVQNIGFMLILQVVNLHKFCNTTISKLLY